LSSFVALRICGAHSSSRPDSRRLADLWESPEEQNEIRNPSDRVVVVAARFALDEYRKYSAYICQSNRSFRRCVRMAFYTKNKIDRRISKILGHIEEFLVAKSRRGLT